MKRDISAHWLNAKLQYLDSSTSWKTQRKSFLCIKLDLEFLNTSLEIGFRKGTLLAKFNTPQLSKDIYIHLRHAHDLSMKFESERAGFDSTDTNWYCELCTVTSTKTPEEQTIYSAHLVNLKGSERVYIIYGTWHENTTVWWQCCFHMNALG